MNPITNRTSIVRVFTNFQLTGLDLEHINRGFRSFDTSTKLFFNESGRADLAVVINCSSRFSFAYGSNLLTAKWLMEPVVDKRFTHLFTRRHSRVFDLVFTHSPKPGNIKERRQAPLIPPHVPDGNQAFLLSNKDRLTSAIGSREMTLPLHRARTLLLDSLEADSERRIDVFGKGRKYINSKSEGLDRYMYSIAIENSSSPDYWTEKISDCFLSMTVPIYVGAPNISDYFPAGSFVAVRPEELVDGIRKALKNASREDYLARIPHLLEARKLVMEKYNFGVELANLLERKAKERLGSRKLTRLWGIDTVILLAVKFLSRAIHFLKLFWRKTPRRSDN